MEKIIIKTADENTKIVELVLQKLKIKNSNLLLLIGDLGAGKTTFTSLLAKYLNTKFQVSSPTFVIQKIYNLDSNEYNFSKIYHLDLYRLGSVEEVLDMGLLEDIKQRENLYIIEWPEKILDIVSNYVKVTINTLPGDSREFEIDLR